MAKTDPERRRELIEQGRAARAQMQEIMDRYEGRRRAWEEARERRRRFWRRVLSLGLKT